jgi:hypothetical protein
LINTTALCLYRLQGEGASRVAASEGMAMAELPSPPHRHDSGPDAAYDAGKAGSADAADGAVRVPSDDVEVSGYSGEFPHKRRHSGQHTQHHHRKAGGSDDAHAALITSDALRSSDPSNHGVVAGGPSRPHTPGLW